ncbi:MAG: baseplate J protein [Desulfatitalea sp.]|nr:baseplate J/gp47 family protein [Desulfatitalea sp.]NNK01226.1 baseplate J protein [Desulfatitalea sp.]
MGRASIAYSNKDYNSIRRELLAKTPLLTDRWTDFNHSDLGVVLLELFCGIGDMLAYYLDVQAAEAFLPTARQRQNVIDLCKLIGYRLDTPVAASLTIRFSLNAPLGTDLIITAGTVCRALLDDGQADFETVEDGLIPRGVLTVSVLAHQGVRRTETFAATGQTFQRLQLTCDAIAQGSITVAIAQETWVEVGHFQDSASDSLHFMADTDALDITTVIFSDGRNGVVPPSGTEITVSYLETLGERGNLAPGRITHLLTPVYSEGVQIPLSVTNPGPATGGTSRETIEHARRQAPAELRTLWKAVTLEDYKALAESFPGVAKAQVVDTNDCQNIRYYQVNMVVAPDGGGPPSALLKQDLLAFLESRKVITVEINLFDPVYRPVNIDAEIFAYAGEDLDVVRSRAENMLEDFFAFDRMNFGAAVHWSDLVAALDAVRGVSHLRMYAPQQDIDIRPGEIAALGQVNLDVRSAS